MHSLVRAYTSRIAIQGPFQLLKGAGAGVGDSAVRKLPEPRLADARSESKGAPSTDRQSRRLKLSNRSNSHRHSTLAKDCELVKQPFENGAHDNGAVEDAKKVLRQNLRALLEKHYQGSQNALAKASGVAQTTIGNYLRNDYTGHAQLDNVAKLAKALHLQEAYILLVPGLILGRGGPASEREIEQEVQHRLEARWNAVAREVEHLRVADEKEETTGRAAADTAAAREAPAERSRKRKS